MPAVTLRLPESMSQLNDRWKRALAPLFLQSLVALSKLRAGRATSIILLVQFHNERARLPEFFSNVLPHVDGIIGLDDGSDDGSGEYFEAQPKVLSVVYRPVRIPHEWDEPANRRELMRVASQYRPDWLLALDVDERLELDFRCRIQPYLRAAQWLGRTIVSQPLREMWDSLSTYRCDGIWNGKRRQRLFRWSAHHQVDPKAFHGTWTSVVRGASERALASPIPIYHLGMLTETMRQQRVEKYQALDPEHRFQPIGYAYLNCKDGLCLASVHPDQDFQLLCAAPPSLALRGQARFFKALSGVLKWSQIVGTNLSSLESVLRLQRKLDSLLRHLSRSRNRFGEASGGEMVSGARSFMLVSEHADIERSRPHSLVGRLCWSRGYHQMSLEPVVQLLTSVHDERLRNAIAMMVLEALFKRFPSGVIFELPAACFMALTPCLSQIESGAHRLSDLCAQVRLHTRLHFGALARSDVRVNIYYLAADGVHGGLGDSPKPSSQWRFDIETSRFECGLSLDESIRAQAVIEQFECSPFFQ